MRYLCLLMVTAIAGCATSAGVSGSAKGARACKRAEPAAAPCQCQGVADRETVLKLQQQYQVLHMKRLEEQRAFENKQAASDKRIQELMTHLAVCKTDIKRIVIRHQLREQQRKQKNKKRIPDG